MRFTCGSLDVSVSGSGLSQRHNRLLAIAIRDRIAVTLPKDCSPPERPLSSSLATELRWCCLICSDARTGAVQKTLRGRRFTPSSKFLFRRRQDFMRANRSAFQLLPTLLLQSPEQSPGPGRFERRTMRSSKLLVPMGAPASPATSPRTE